MLRSEKTISVLAEKIPAETERLSALEVPKMRESIKVAEAAKKQIADKKVEPAEESLRKAEDLWNTNEIVKQLRPELETLRATASAEPQPEPAPGPEKSAEEKSADASSSDKPVDVQVEGEKPFLLTPGGIITAIVVLALLFAGVTVYKKIRSKASDILE